MSIHKLINPLFSNNEFTSNNNNPYNAASEIWSNLSEYIRGHVPFFHYTIQNTNNGDMHHFKVNESVHDGDTVKYDIEKYDVPNENAEIISIHKNAIQNGGYSKLHKHHKHHKHSSSSSSSSTSSDDDSISSSSSSYSSDDNTYPFRNKKTTNIMLPYSSPEYIATYYPAIYNIEDVLLPTFLKTLYGNTTANIKIVIPTDYRL